MRWGPALLLLAACTRPTPPPPAPAPPVASPPSIDGVWTRTLHRETRESQTHLQEAWTLEEGPQGRVRGQIDQYITYTSTSGVPFACNQSEVMRRFRRIELEGQRKAAQLELRETRVEEADGLCAPLVLPASSYHLELRESSPARLLVDGQDVHLEPGESLGRWPDTPRSVVGPWRSMTRSEAGGLSRREEESWLLTESADGRIRGRYYRLVSVEDVEGKSIPCADSHRYQHLATYEIGGRRTDEGFELFELSSRALPHPCLSSTRRSFDSAEGRRVRSAIELNWRGGRRQILHAGHASELMGCALQALPDRLGGLLGAWARKREAAWIDRLPRCSSPDE